jgi:hypothetical protein
VPSFLGLGDEQDAIDLVHLDELHLDALAAGGGQVLAYVVGADGKLTMAAIDQARELDPRGSSVLEKRLDRGSDRPAGREDVVDQDAGHAFEGEVELGGPHDRLGVPGSLSVTNDDVVAMERDVDAAESDLDASEIRDVAPEALGERNPAGVNSNEGGALEITVSFDDLVSDAGERPVQGLGIQQDLARFDLRSQQRLLSGLAGPG